MDFFINLNWMMLLKCFIVGGLICVIGQILIDKTKLTLALIIPDCFSKYLDKPEEQALQVIPPTFKMIFFI